MKVFLVPFGVVARLIGFGSWKLGTLKGRLGWDLSVSVGNVRRPVRRCATQRPITWTRHIHITRTKKRIKLFMPFLARRLMSGVYWSNLLYSSRPSVFEGSGYAPWYASILHHQVQNRGTRFMLTRPVYFETGCQTFR